MFSHSPKLRLEWKNRAGTGVWSYSRTRWWSKWQVMEQLNNMFGDVVEFLLADAPSSASILRKRLKETVQCLESRARLQMQLSVAVEFGCPFAEATYRLEGDGALCIRAYEEVRALTNFVSAQPLHLPSTLAVARALAAGNHQHKVQWRDFAQECVVPAIAYFNAKFGEGGPLFQNLQAFRAARLFDPVKVAEMQPDANYVASLLSFPFVSEMEVEEMQTQLPHLLAACEDVRAANPSQWWKEHEAQFPMWSAVFKKVLLVQPSPAAERVFSLLKNSFGRNQASALEDYIEGSLMLQYNHT